MNYPGVLADDAETLAKIEAALTCGKPVDGHAPGLHGQQRQKYAQTGISTDHEHHAAPPAATPLSGKSIGELQIMLDNAVKAEKYEFASDIKKEILRRQTDRPF